MLNADDPTVGYFRERARDRVITYGLDAEADIRAWDLAADAGGTTFRLSAPRWTGSGRVALPGRFNVSNALAALGVVEALGLDFGAAAASLPDAGRVPGRMEPVDAGQPFEVIVDYAHTADALGKVLEVLRPITEGRLIVVFGSAGERDPASGRRWGAWRPGWPTSSS